MVSSALTSQLSAIVQRLLPAPEAVALVAVTCRPHLSLHRYLLIHRRNHTQKSYYCHLHSMMPPKQNRQRLPGRARRSSGLEQRLEEDLQLLDLQHQHRFVPESDQIADELCSRGKV
jgi:hypothetical protein